MKLNEIEDNLKNIEFKTIQEVVFNSIQNGELPNSKPFFDLYKDMEFKNFEEKKELSDYIEILSLHYEKVSKDEKIILNNLLFILNFLNGKDDLKGFLKRSLLLKYNYKNQELVNNANFFLTCKIEDSLLLETVEEIFEGFFALEYEQRRTVFIKLLSIVWNNKNFYNNKIWLKIFDNLVKLLTTCREKGLIEDEMYIHFFAYHIYGNNIETTDEWRIFDKKVDSVASLFYKEWGEKNSLMKSKDTISKDKKKIGILIDRLVFNSPYMVTYSLFENLMKNEDFTKEYEIYVYSLNYIDKNPDDQRIVDELMNLGICVYSPQNEFLEDGLYYSHVRKALILREIIIKDSIDYLISSCFGYDIPNFLFSNRTAPKQIYWSHGNCTCNILNIDKRISHFSQECKEFEWSIFNVSMATKFLIGSEEDKKAGKTIKEKYLQTYGKDTVILGTIGRLIKIYNDEYIQTIAKIMKQNQNTIYLACGDGNSEEIKKILKKYGIDEEKFIFMGQVNPHVYGWVIDVWCETFPLRQGNSRNEVEAKGGTIIGYKKYYSKGAINTIENFAKELKIDSPLANSLNEFSKLATKAINDKEYRKKLGILYKKVREKYSNFNFDKFIKVLDCK